MSLIDQAQAAYEKVAGFPEARGDKGWTDLLTLRNMVPDLIDALRQSTTEYTACIATVSQLENGSAVETPAPNYPHKVGCPASPDMPVGLWVCTCSVPKTPADCGVLTFEGRTPGGPCTLSKAHRGGHTTADGPCHCECHGSPDGPCRQVPDCEQCVGGDLCPHKLPIDADCEHCDGPAF